LHSDEWSQYRSYLNHTELSNNFRWALDPDRAGYAEAAIKGKSKEPFTDIDEQNDFDETKKRINGWPDLRIKILDHARKVNANFNPYSLGFSILHSYLSSADIIWLQKIVREDMIIRFRLDQWNNDVAQSIAQIDNELINIKEGKSTIKALRTATDNCMNIFSGRGYFNYGHSI
jgi:hypothetical protein